MKRIVIGVMILVTLRANYLQSPRILPGRVVSAWIGGGGGDVDRTMIL